MLKCFVFLCAATSVVLARTMPVNKKSIDEQPKTSENVEKSPGDSSILSDFGALYKMYQTCSNMDVSVCLKLKLFGVMNNASRSMKDIELFDGVKFIATDDEYDASEPIVTEDELVKQLPRSLEDKESALTSLIWDKVVSFFQSHTLQIKLPSEDDIKRSMSESREKKKKEKGALIMIPLLLGGTFIPIAYGALALLAGKALIVSKLALVLASIIGIKKLVSHSSGHHESSHEVVVSGGHGGSGWGRDFDLAYNAYIPKDRNQNQIE